MALVDETGNVYGYLTVLRRAKPEEYQAKDRAARWVCQCKCGNITIVKGTALRSGVSKSCGCYQAEVAKGLLEKRKIEEIGNRYGKLLVISEYGKTKNRTVIWTCRCDCGNYINVPGTDLRSGHTKSCGCTRLMSFQNTNCSKGENLISIILKNEKIPFEQEKSFSEDKKVKYYRFDFYLPNQQICIEFQGEQHYHYSQFFHKTKSDFTKAQERDRRKVNFCLANNISLYCIPYWEIDNIHTFADLTAEKFHATTQYHNDIVWREHQKRK